MTDLRYRLQTDDRRAEAALRFVLDSLGVDAQASIQVEDDGVPVLVYGNEIPAAFDGVSIARRPGDRFWAELLDGDPDPDVGRRIPFDLVDAIASFLDDRVHDGLPPEAFDGHGRLSYDASLPARAGHGRQPVVNRYVAYLGRFLRDRLGVVGRPRWPDGRVAAIGLSHDVDEPERYALLQSAVRPWRLRRSPRTYLGETVRLARLRARDRNPDDFWLFEDVTRTERQAGVRSTFFFATVPFHGAAGAPRDVAYDVRRSPYRRVFRRLVADGFEVGLHASYRAHRSADRLRGERESLGRLAGTEVIGLRHHYWQLGPDVAATLRAHQAAGFKYDSSLAFNDHVGFRRSVALPFRPYDAVLGRPLTTLQLPTFCMDGNLFYRSSDVDAAVAEVSALVDEIVATNGFGAIDWHIQTSYPGNAEFRPWGIAYQEILSMLAARPEIWTTDLGSVQRWVDDRSADRPGGPGRAADRVEAVTGA